VGSPTGSLTRAGSPAWTAADADATLNAVPTSIGQLGAATGDVAAAGWHRLNDGLQAWLSGHHRRITPRGMLGAIVLGAALAGAALTGEGWAAGFGSIARLTTRADWRWLPVAVGCVVVSHGGYTLAYRQVLRSRGGPTVSVRRMGVSVLAGFGLLTPRAGFTLDRAFWGDHGLSDDAARGRVFSLGMLEYALLAPAAFVAAVVLFLQNFPARGGVLVSWLIGVPVGAGVVGLLFVFRRRLPTTGRLWNAVRQSLDAIAAMLRVVVESPVGLLAAGGMALYWAADIAALGACLAVVHHAVPIDVLIVGYATGYAFTRRSLPLAGAGAAEALMPFAMHWMTVPLAAGVLAVFAYRLCNLWLPLGPAALAMRHLRGTSVAIAA
jgi:Lysylphosphatidylglycerol synthase TM region